MRLTTCMLADGARIAQDGKLYVFGGQWDRIFAATVPITHPTMTVVLVIEVGYDEALAEHQLELTLRRADGEPAGPKTLGRFNVGHPAGLDRGASVWVPMALEHPAVMFDSYGRYEWLIEIDGAEVGRLPVAISPAQGPLPFASAPAPPD